MIPTKRLWTAKPLLVAYVVALGFTVGLLINRTPVEEAVPTLGGGGAKTGQHGLDVSEEERNEPPLWMQLFRPSPPTARLLLRMGLPLLTIADGSAGDEKRPHLLIYWTGRTGEKPQTLFQTTLPFMRPPVPEVTKSPPPSPPTGPNLTPSPQVQVTEQKPPVKELESQPAAKGVPLVGIYHTHDWESYISEFPGRTVKTQDDLNAIASWDHKKKTVVEIGQTLAEALRGLGVTPVHAFARHPDYSFAYRQSRETVQQILSEAPSVKVLLDLHRDGALGRDSTAVIKGQKVAQIRCIIGVNQPRWQENKAFCTKLMTRLEKLAPGITLETFDQKYIYNQDLMPGSILLEIGNATNQYSEAERAVTYLAQAVADLVRAGEYPK